MKTNDMSGFDFRQNFGESDNIWYQISEIEPNLLYLSGAPRMAQHLHKLRIKNVLNVAKEIFDSCIDYHDDIKVVHFPFRDHIPMEPWLVREALVTLRGMLQTGPTLVHCGVGISRSPTTIALYFYAIGRFATVQEGVEYLQSKRECVRPNRIVDAKVMQAVDELKKEWSDTRKLEVART